MNKIKAFIASLSSKQINSILGCFAFIVMSITFQMKVMDYKGLTFQLIYGFFCVIFIASALTGLYGTITLKKKWLMHHLFFSIVYFILDGINDYRFIDGLAGKLGIHDVFWVLKRKFFKVVCI